jgi:hypothetical protein
MNGVVPRRFSLVKLSFLERVMAAPFFFATAPFLRTPYFFGKAFFLRKVLRKVYDRGN